MTDTDNKPPIDPKEGDGGEGKKRPEDVSPLRFLDESEDGKKPDELTPLEQAKRILDDVRAERQALDEQKVALAKIEKDIAAVAKKAKSGSASQSDGDEVLERLIRLIQKSPAGDDPAMRYMLEDEIPKEDIIPPDQPPRRYYARKFAYVVADKRVEGGFQRAPYGLEAVFKLAYANHTQSGKETNVMIVSHYETRLLKMAEFLDTHELNGIEFFSRASEALEADVAMAERIVSYHRAYESMTSNDVAQRLIELGRQPSENPRENRIRLASLVAKAEAANDKQRVIDDKTRIERELAETGVPR